MEKVAFFWQEISLAIYAILSINVLLHLLYSAFRTKWPDVYFSSDEKIALLISTSPRRLAVFRLLPPLIISAIVLNVVMPNEAIGVKMLVGALTLGVYALSTDGVALYRLVARSSGIAIYFNRTFQILLHAGVLITLMAIGSIAGYLSSTSFVRAVSPTLQGLVDNIWSAGIAVIILFALNEVFSSEDTDIEVLLRRSYRSLSAELLGVIDEESRVHSAKRDLVLAIAVVENIQRPSWLRSVERWLAPIKGEGTYGLMQVRSGKFISDKESIKAAVRQYLANTAFLSDEQLQSKVRAYNPNEKFADLVDQTMTMIRYRM